MEIEAKEADSDSRVISTRAILWRGSPRIASVEARDGFDDLEYSGEEDRDADGGIDIVVGIKGCVDAGADVKGVEGEALSTLFGFA